MSIGARSSDPLRTSRRLVLKIGSALLVDQEKYTLHAKWMQALVQDIVALHAEDREVVIVSSGSIALGRRHLRLSHRASLSEHQAASAIGQVRLAHAWQEVLAAADIVVAQILLSLDDTEERRRHLNARAALKALLDRRAVPVINENNSVATNEIRFGDNDTLAARVAAMIDADTLLLLSDIDGLYTVDPRKDPTASFIEEVWDITPEIASYAGPAVSGCSSGGMVTKLQAARIATSGGCRLAILDGRPYRPIKALREGSRCTWFKTTVTAVKARKRWIAGALKLCGRVQVDDGAKMALANGKSLLPAGVTSLAGEFRRGDAVCIVDSSGREIGRGLSAYDKSSALRILGRRSADILGILGYHRGEELIHRDDLAITANIGLLKERRPDRPTRKSRVGDMQEQSQDLHALLRRIARAARKTGRLLAQTSGVVRASALRAAARHLRAQQSAILEANRKDMHAARQKGRSAAFLDRLKLTPERVAGIAQSMESVASLPDPLRRTLAQWRRPNGLYIRRVSVPIGVVAIVYESRPNVTADAAALCLKSGNAAILRAGSESFHSAAAILFAVHQGLREVEIPTSAVQGIPTTDRAAVGLLMSMSGDIDVLIPRGGRALTERIAKESRVPTLLHLEGVCHTYVHRSADPEMARRVVVNAKMRRPGICGATEALLVDRAWGARNLRVLLQDLRAAGCALRGDEETRKVLPKEVEPATSEDWGKEFLGPVLAVRVVADLEQAAAHIQEYGSGHTEAIVGSEEEAAQRFREVVDASIVFHNVSTQYADGGEFGMGAEIGISTGRLHARGPVGAAQLTSYTYWVSGDGLARPE